MESVGRNTDWGSPTDLRVDVALRMESVGRNTALQQVVSGRCMSLSAWRAWVEMLFGFLQRQPTHVALRMESVGRNRISDFF